MVDLRGDRTATPLTVEPRASTGAELLRCAAVLLSHDRLTFDVGAERIEHLRDELAPDLWDELRWLSGSGTETPFLLLSEVAATVPAPGTIAQLRAAFAADELLAWRRFVSKLEPAGEHRDAGLTDELLRRLGTGDPGALDELYSLDLPVDDCPAVLAVLLQTTPSEYRDRLVAFIDRFEREVFAGVADEALDAMTRDVEHRAAQLAAGIPPAQVVLEATNGFELDEQDPGLRRVVLMPSFWFRPWLVIGRLGDTEAIGTPVADEFVCLPAETPPPALVKLAKALSDEGRLRLLRRMATGPITLSDAMAELDVAKATAHHHLSLLRQAGLVSLRGEGRRKVYGLRGDPSDAASEALAGYLRPGGGPPASERSA